VWGAFLAAGIGELILCGKSFNALDWMQKGLLPTSKKLCYFSTRQCFCPNCKDNQEVA